MKEYGTELILDLTDCKVTFTRRLIKGYLIALCKKIKMQREDLHFWDYMGDSEGYATAPDHLKGISAVQFIKTSNITIHTLDVSKQILLNIFSCKEFNYKMVVNFSKKWFEAKKSHASVICRGGVA